MLDVIRSIKDFNVRRDPEGLQRKYEALRAHPFAFLRGTCHLFYERMPAANVFERAPVTWICGDLHLENFGSFKGDNRLVYFDLSDFDEAVLAPCTWELVRFLTSVLLAGRNLSMRQSEAIALCRAFLEAYSDALCAGKARWIERETTDGMIRELLDGLRGRLWPNFLDRRTERKGKKRAIRLDGKKALPVTSEQRSEVKALVKAFAVEQPNPKFFKVIDVARRIAGTGSLGVDRYAILIEGKGSPDGNYLLDLKQALPSCLARHLKIKQPRWKTEAGRVVGIQQRMQAVSPAFLRPVMKGRASYVLRDLQPTEDRVALDKGKRTRRRLDDVIRTMGELVAWAELRSGGRDGAAIADELIDFGRQGKWEKQILEAARHCSAQAESDWRLYAEAFDQGVFRADR
jgi:uncharacterized protein (DUF2252 family)